MKLSRLLLVLLIAGAVGGYFAEPYLRSHFFAEKKKPVVVKPTVEEPTEPQKKEEPVDIFDVEPMDEEPVPEPEPEPEVVEDTTPEPITTFEGEGKEGTGQESAFMGEMSPSAWASPDALEKRLSNRIRSQLKKIDAESVMALLGSPENRLMIAQWQMLHVADKKAFAQVMRDAHTSRDLNPMLNDLKWIAPFVYDGELEKPEVALAMIRHFRQTDENMDHDVLRDGDGQQAGLKRRVAGGIAAEFARNGWYGDTKELTNQEIALMKEQGIPIPRKSGKGKVDNYRLARERYLFMAESVDRELFNSNFYTMPDWLMRFVCGWKGDSPFGSASTMRWLRDNASAPSGAYMGMAYRVPYLPTNPFGASIHSSLYYEPYESQYEGNYAKMTRDVGSVCGGLSHYGTSAACANGVPAFTMGETGHCAYAVYHEGKWHPCNSISEEHFPHWRVWGDCSWSALMMMTDMYKDPVRTRNAQMLCSVATMFADNRNTDEALDLYEMAVGMQPLYKPALAFYVEAAAASRRLAPKKWLGVNLFVCESIAAKHPEMCSKFLTEQIYPAMLAVVRGDKMRMQAFRTYFDNIKEDEDGEWDMEKLLNLQYNSLGKGQKIKMEYMQLVVETAAKKPPFSRAITWALRTATQENKRMGAKVLELVDAAAATSPDKELVDAAVIRAAEELGDGALVHKYSEPYIEQPAEGMPEFERPEGTLVSADGFVQLGKTHPEQRSIIRHMAALTEKGGMIRSDAGKHQPVTLVLPKSVPIGSIIIIPNGGTKEYRTWKVDVSEDGKAWETLMQLPDGDDRPLVRIDYKRNFPKARFIRVDSGSKQEVGIQFKAFLVYDNKKKAK